MARPDRAIGDGRNGSRLSPDYLAPVPGPLVPRLCEGYLPARTDTYPATSWREGERFRDYTVEETAHLVHVLGPDEVYIAGDEPYQPEPGDGRTPVRLDGSRFWTIDGADAWQTVRLDVSHPGAEAILRWEPPDAVSIVGLEREPKPDRPVRLLAAGVPLLMQVIAERRRGARFAVPQAVADVRREYRDAVLYLRSKDIIPTQLAIATQMGIGDRTLRDYIKTYRLPRPRDVQ